MEKDNCTQKTLWVGDIEVDMDEHFILTLFSTIGDVVNVKIIRDKNTGLPSGYGFIEFVSREIAENIVKRYNGKKLPNSDKAFKLAWASHSHRSQSGISEWNLYVGDLSDEVDDQNLLEIFEQKFPSVKGARVVLDLATQTSKGYGFVRFGDESERREALASMTGTILSGKPIKVSLPTQDLNNGNSEYDSCTLYISGLNPTVQDNEKNIRQAFQEYGDLVYLKITYSKATCYIQFREKDCAENAQKGLHESLIGSQKIKVAFKNSKVNNNNNYPQNINNTINPNSPTNYYYQNQMQYYYLPQYYPNYPTYYPPYPRFMVPQNQLINSNSNEDFIEYDYNDYTNNFLNNQFSQLNLSQDIIDSTQLNQSNNEYDDNVLQNTDFFQQNKEEVEQW